MEEDRPSQKYIDGVKGFIQFAFTHGSAKGNSILCPCKNCLNIYWLEASIVQEHLICEGFVSGYRTWVYHGEASSPLSPVRDADIEQCDEEVEEGDDLEEDCDELAGMIRDMRHDFGDLSDNEDDGGHHADESDPFQQLAGDAAEELYPGCTCFSKLRFVVRLLHIKSLGGWCDNSFNMLLELLAEAFPEGSKLPKNFYEAKKMIRCLRLDYVSIHACDNDCILFWKEHANADSCPNCKASR